MTARRAAVWVLATCTTGALLVPGVVVPSPGQAEVDGAAVCQPLKAMMQAPQVVPLQGGAVMRVWTSRDKLQRVVQVTLPGGSRAQGWVQASGAAVLKPVVDHARDAGRAVVAVNAGYYSDTTGAVTGPLASGGQILALSRESAKGRKFQRVFSTGRAGSMSFGWAGLSGALVSAQGEVLPVAAVNDLGHVSSGAVVLTSDYFGQSPSRVRLRKPMKVAYVSGGRLSKARTTDIATPTEARYAVVTSNTTAARFLEASRGEGMDVRLSMTSSPPGPRRGVVQVGARLVRGGKPAIVRCPAREEPWQSRPRLGVGLGTPADPDALTLVSVRGPALGKLGQYDSGATEGQMSHLMADLGVLNAYALDAGSALQVAVRRSSGGFRLVDRAPGAPFDWQRPVPAALVLRLPGAAGAT